MTANVKFPALLDAVPVIGLAVWAVILSTAPLRRPDWAVMPETFKGTIFLLALVTSASMMPVEKLPAASWQTALGLGFVSAVFDNIPLTALALKQGGYDWGYLAYAVGFGGSMIWFGSSAGVALSNMYPEAKSVGLWLRHGWHVAIAYVDRIFRDAARARLASRRAMTVARRPWAIIISVGPLACTSRSSATAISGYEPAAWSRHRAPVQRRSTRSGS